MPNYVLLMDAAYDAGRMDGRCGRAYNPPASRLEAAEYARGYRHGAAVRAEVGGL